MRLNKKNRPTGLIMDMTPMIDVAFQLIIFFMTVSQMSEISSEPLQLPKQTGEEITRPKTVIVNIDEAGELKIGGASASLAQLVSITKNELNQVGQDPNLVHVVIRADERGQSRGLNEVVTALSQMNITRIRIAVQGE